MKRMPVTFALPTDRQVGLGVLAIIAIIAALAFAAGAAFGAPAHQPGPAVVSDTAGHRDTADSVRLLVVKNPRHDRVTVVVWCRKDPRSMTEATIAPRGQTTFEMASDRPLVAGDCELARWSR
jgi:hypothetical protein